jgi:hypothetical protein
MRRNLFILTLLALFCIAAPGLAQDEVPKVEYGETVTGEITNRYFEVEYLFSGSAGDVILIEMKDPQDYSGTMGSPAIILLDEKYNVISSLEGYGGSVSFFASLPFSGDYSILATRAGGRAGDSLGEFNLTLNKLPELQPGEPMNGKIPPEKTDYYVVQTDKAFSVAYERLTRGTYPELTISTIYDNRLSEIASLRGQTLVSGAIGITPEAETTGTQAYVISVVSSYSSEEVIVEYTLTLTE